MIVYCLKCLPFMNRCVIVTFLKNEIYAGYCLRIG